MTIDKSNDRLEVFEDAEGMWRWRRVDGGNGKIVATSGEGYVSQDYCREAATTYNAGIIAITELEVEEL